MKRLLILILTASLLAATPPRKRRQPAQQQRTVESVKKEKKSVQREINQTSKQVKANSREVSRQLNRLDALGADIKRGEQSITSMNQRLGQIRSREMSAVDSINALEGELAALRRAYVATLKKMQPQASGMGTLAFLFSSRNFSQAFARIRYLKQFSRWRVKKAEDIRQAADVLAAHREQLAGLRSDAEATMSSVRKEQSRLVSNQNEAQKLVASLKKEGSTLRQELAQRQRRATELDRELDRLIAAQIEKERKERERKEQAERQRKEREEREERERLEKERIAQEKATSPAPPTANTTKKADNKKPAKEKGKETKPATKQPANTQPATNASGGNFASLKGRLPYPVDGGKVSRPFGRHPHPTLPGVETENSGIDIQAAGGATCHVVADGTVSAIFKQDGYNSIVMVRHGKYITIYAGIGSVAVRQGDKLKARQSLGSLYADPDNGGKSTLHFEIRNERDKLNPQQWLK